MAIRFFTENVSFNLKQKNHIKEWVKSIIHSEGYKARDLSFIFTNDHDLIQINKEYLNHDTLTDIITFNYNEDKNIEGDIFISIERVKENATQLNIPFYNELHRVIIHGVLHLLNYNDKTKEEKEEMRNKEEICLVKFNQMFHVEH